MGASLAMPSVRCDASGHGADLTAAAQRGERARELAAHRPGGYERRVQLGLYLRNMGPQSTRESLVECARAAEAAGLDSVWVADHVAIPPDDAEGSNGRYLDPLATLAYLAGATSRIGLGTGVLVLPYRAALPTAKWVATIQELSGGRFLFGVGAGWMRPEFRALGVDIDARGKATDATLELIHRCFASGPSDEVENNGQRFLFRPNPQRPPIYVGGAAPHALRRAVRWGDGWMPMGANPEQLAPPVGELRRMAEHAGKPAPEVVLMTTLAIDDPPRATAQAHAFAEAGATAVVHAWRYADAAEFRGAAETLGGVVRDAVAAL
jgi:probable F420-dependent oxidoreductase